tara:strand:+ start:4735 stop:5586 length:852 start_codon:yes stop_codon:yes gene_type:complete
MKTILITGGNGILGSQLSKINLYNYKIISVSKNDRKISLDVTNSHDVKECLDNYKPDFIINCAGYTNVDQSEVYKNLTHDVNVKGLINLIKFSNVNTKIIHISSDYVFDGLKGDYIESDITRPINYYGKTKLESENFLIGSNRKYIIFRPNVIFDLNGFNFFSFIYNSLKNNQKINIVTDQISNPTFAPHFSKIIIDSILLDIEGVFHFGSLDIVSRYDFAVKIAEIFKLNKDLIKPITSNLLKQKAKRPLNTSLNCNKIANNMDIEIMPLSYYLEDSRNCYE